jgi:hypothetical protein
MGSFPFLLSLSFSGRSNDGRPDRHPSLSRSPGYQVTPATWIFGSLVGLPFDELDDLEIRGTESTGDAIWHVEAKVQRHAGAKQILYVEDLVTDVK